MKGLDAITGKSNLRQNAHILLSLFAGMILLMLLYNYAGLFTHRHDETIALLFTILFIMSIYAGRFISSLWVDKNKKIKTWVWLIIPALALLSLFLTVALAAGFVDHQQLSMGVPLIFFSLIFCICTGALIKLIRVKVSAQLQEAEINVAHSQSEVQLLQSQLSPHFLFNTLNNLYGISITDHEKLPTLLLKLSELLRYSVYEAGEAFVPLNDEINYLKNYIDFEKIRIGERLKLELDIEEITDKRLQISPMLLIVFVENAFKYSKNTTDLKIYIQIGIKIWGNSLLFYVRNSKGIRQVEPESTLKYQGLGLSNVKKRLDLLYPNGHDLKIEDGRELYGVMLRLNIKK